MKNNGHKIVSRLGVLAGKPVIKGTRISVPFILNLLKNRLTAEQITEEYPHLKESDISAAIEYAEDILEKEDVMLYKASK